MEEISLSLPRIFRVQNETWRIGIKIYNDPPLFLHFNCPCQLYLTSQKFSLILQLQLVRIN